MRKEHPIIIKNRTLTILVILIFLFAACNGDNSKKDEQNLSRNGIALANRAVNAYQLLNNALRNQQYDNEMIRILTDHSPATYLMQLNESKSAIIEGNIKRQSALVQFRKAYSAYNLLLDRNFDFGSSNLKNRLYTASTELDSFEISDFYSDRVEVLKQLISGGRFKEQVAILELSNLYADLWDYDSKKWLMLIENELKNYKEGINQVAHDSFDASKVKTLVDKPYKNEAVLVNLYKLQLVKEKELQLESLMDEIQKVSDGFEILIELNGELAKKKQNQEHINKLNDELEAIVIQ